VPHAPNVFNDCSRKKGRARIGAVRNQSVSGLKVK
jgi:hypothetical protein